MFDPDEGINLETLVSRKAHPVDIMLDEDMSGSLLPVGNYRIRGQVLEQGEPVQRVVYLYVSGDIRVLKSATMSDASGNYEFTNLPYQEYVVMARDPNKVFVAAIQDAVYPELMV